MPISVPVAVMGPFWYLADVAFHGIAKDGVRGEDKLQSAVELVG